MDRNAPPPDDLRDVPCADQSGFLFRHPCGRLARVRCAECNKPVCERHLHRLASTGQHLCAVCAAQHPEAMGQYHDSPYFYGPRYYHGYRSYWLYDDDEPDFYDFTDADSSSVTTEGDESFENDLGAS